MKLCERCFEEYPEEEFTQIEQFGKTLICLPCKHQFEMQYKDFLTHFLCQGGPERDFYDNYDLPVVRGSTKI